MKKSTISPEQLINDGWVKTDDSIVLYEKKIENKNPLNATPEDTDISLVLHRLFGSPMFGVSFPNGSMLNFFAESIEDLKKFEEMILFYDCEY